MPDSAYPMNNHLADQLQQLRAHDPDIAAVLNTFDEIDQIYREALEATGSVSSNVSLTKNFGEMTLSFDRSSSCTSY